MLSEKVASNLVTLRGDPAAKAKLQDILGFCFSTLKTYGKEPEQMDAANKMFQFILADYPIDKISEAFKYYFSTNSEMPTPADIVGIIKRGKKPPLDKSVYIALSKKEEHQRSFEEDDYIREYEQLHCIGETER